MKQVQISSITIGGDAPLALLAGPCIIENRDMVFRTAEVLKTVTDRLSIPFLFKASYKKANRTSLAGFSGVGIEEALAILAEVRERFECPIVTDIHTEIEAPMAAEAADVLQIPAFLSRQTELLLAAGRTGRAVNIKKGQFLAPEDMGHAAEKVASTGNENVLLCERGTCFGYHNLVVDMRSLVIMRQFGYPIVMDATHAVQIPSLGGVSGGKPEFIFPLARAAAAVGIDALFVETHPDPKNALSDAASQLLLDDIEVLLLQVLAIDKAAREGREIRSTGREYD